MSLSICDAAKSYTELGWIVHPLSSPKATVNSPGKKPMLNGWADLKEPIRDIDKQFSNGCNIGLVCGNASNVTVIDFDDMNFYDAITEGLDTSDWLVSHRIDGRCHLFFKYDAELKQRMSKKCDKASLLGIDILSTNEKGGGSNCVLPPSVHVEGQTYEFNRSPENIPEMPEEFKKRLDGLVWAEDQFYATVCKCRKWVKDFFSNPDILHGGHGRRCMLAITCELLANGLDTFYSNDVIHFVARIVYRQDYDEKRTDDEFKNVSDIPWKAQTLIDNFPEYCNAENTKGGKRRKNTEDGKKAEENGKGEKKDEDKPTKQIDEESISTEMMEESKAHALLEMQNGDPMKYMCKTAESIHIGDERAIEAIILAIANQSCLNTQGLQIKLSGESGGGKSHASKSVCHCLRNKHVIESSLSAKAAYYMKLKAGTILFSDDTDISPDMETVIKRSTTNYQDYTMHTTVKDGSAFTMTIPPRILWMITSVDDNVSEQLLNRQLIFNVDTSREQKDRIFEMQKREALQGENKTLEVTKEVLVCREMWDMIKSKTFKVRIPYIDDVDTMDKSNSRNFPMFTDMLKGYTIINYMQRDTDDGGYLLATTDDFYAAKTLFESQTESVLTKLNEKERKIIQVIGQAGKIGTDINTISTATGISYHTVRNTLKGRVPGTGGLLEKVKKLRHIDESKSESIRDGEMCTATTTKRKERFILENFNGWDIFDNGFVFLKTDVNS